MTTYRRSSDEYREQRERRLGQELVERLALRFPELSAEELARSVREPAPCRRC